MTRPTNTLFLLQFFLSRAQALLFATFRAKHDRPTIYDEADLKKHLLILLNFIHCLTQSNKPKDFEVLQQLSTTWAALQHYKDILTQKGSMPHPAKDKLSHLLASIGSFPPNNEMPIEYYLRTIQGTTWNPFPLQDFFATLHLNEQILLQSWILSIKEIIEDLPFI